MEKEGASQFIPQRPKSKEGYGVTKKKKEGQQ
jgi:hypothetical protein